MFSLGMLHDGEGNGCRAAPGNIMSSSMIGRDGLFHWSACSRNYLHGFLR